MNIVSEYYATNGVSYGVVRKNDSYYQIYKYRKSNFGDNDISEFITHRTTLKSARKVAVLLAHAYKEGYADGSY